MKISATLLNFIMMCVILYFSIKEGLPEETSALLLVTYLISTNVISILAIMTKVSKNKDVIKEQNVKFPSKLKSIKHLGVILIFLGFLVPSATYPLTSLDKNTQDIQLLSAVKGTIYSPSFRELKLQYSSSRYDYIKFKYVVFFGTISFFLGSALLIKESFFKDTE